MRYLLFVSVVGFFLSTTVETRAQVDPVVNYFPLEVGNSWVYFDFLEPPPDFIPDTTFYDSNGVFGEVMIDDTLYFETQIAGFEKLRMDDMGRVWTYIDGSRSFLLFDFTLDDGAIVEYGQESPIFADRRLTVHKIPSIDTHIGRFEDALWFSYEFQGGGVDGGIGYKFAPNVGIIERFFGGGQTRKIYSAFVSGVFVLDKETRSDIPESVSLLQLYPNPFTATTTVSYSVPNPSEITIEVYDILGKRVRVLEQGFRAAGMHKVQLDATELSAGVYFVRLSAAAVKRTQKLIVVK